MFLHADSEDSDQTGRMHGHISSIETDHAQFFIDRKRQLSDV